MFHLTTAPSAMPSLTDGLESGALAVTDTEGTEIPLARARPIRGISGDVLRLNADDRNAAPAQQKTPENQSFSGESVVLPKVGLEPTPTCVDRILSPARLPFRHFGGSAARGLAGRGR
jgi:hypothetical protein